MSTAPIGPPAAAPTISAGAAPWLALGPRRCIGRLSKSSIAGSRPVMPGITTSPSDSRCASAAPQLPQVVAWSAAGVAHHGQERGPGVADTPSSLMASMLSPDSSVLIEEALDDAHELVGVGVVCGVRGAVDGHDLRVREDRGKRVGA